MRKALTKLFNTGKLMTLIDTTPYLDLGMILIAL